MQLEERAFGQLGELREMPGFQRHREIFDRYLKDQTFKIATYTYGEDILKDGSFSGQVNTARDRMPIGLPLTKTLEVSTPFERLEDVHIMHPTTVLYPGDFFGLFENFADLRGRWSITAGIKCLRVLTSFGSEKHLKKTNLANPSAAKDHLTWDKKSKLEFFRLVGKINSSDWKAHVLFMPYPEELKDATARIPYKCYLLQWTISQLARLAGSGDDQKFRDPESHSAFIQLIRNLLESTTDGNRCGFYLAQETFKDEIEIDFPYRYFLMNAARYKKSENKSYPIEHLPVFVPGIAKSPALDNARPSRFQNNMFHFLDFEPNTCHLIEKGKAKVINPTVAFLFPSEKPIAPRHVEDWLRPIELAKSQFSSKVNSHPGIRRDSYCLTEGRFISRYDSKAATIVRWYFKFSDKKKEATKPPNYCPAKWLEFLLFKRNLAHNFIDNPMTVNILGLHLARHSDTPRNR